MSGPCSWDRIKMFIYLSNEKIKEQFGRKIKKDLGENRRPFRKKIDKGEW